MTPWLWTKIGAVGVFLALVFAVGHKMGAKAVQARWDASTLKLAQDQTRLLQENAQKIADVVAKQKETNLTVTQDHERALLEIRQKYDADIAASRAGGLRLPGSVCRGSTSTGTKATGSSGRDAAATATIVLPTTLADDLFDFARQADEVTEQARACQNWIRQNQFQ